MHPQLFGLVKSYGLLLALSFVIGIWLSLRRGRARGYDGDTIVDFCLTVLISSVLGVRLFYVLTHLSDFTPWYRVFYFWEGGLTLYGGIILATFAVWWFCRRRGLAFLPMADVLAPQVALGIGITRLGCFLNGCCFGKPTDGPFGIVFPETCAAGWETGCARLHPTQIYSSLGGFLVYALVLIWERRSGRQGSTFARFLLLYGIARFTVDEFRFYEPGAFGLLGLTISQWISLGLAPAGVAILLLGLRKGKDK